MRQGRVPARHQCLIKPRRKIRIPAPVCGHRGSSHAHRVQGGPVVLAGGEQVEQSRLMGQGAPAYVAPTGFEPALPP